MMSVTKAIRQEEQDSNIFSKSKGLGRDPQLADAIANILNKASDASSKEVHLVNTKDWDDIRFIFKSTEYLIHYILTTR